MKALIEEYGLGLITAIVFVILALVYKYFGSQLQNIEIKDIFEVVSKW